MKIFDIRQREIIKAAGIGRRQPVKNNDEEQSSRLRRIFTIARIRMNVNNTTPFYAQKNAKKHKNFQKPLDNKSYI